MMIYPWFWNASEIEVLTPTGTPILKIKEIKELLVFSEDHTTGTIHAKRDEKKTKEKYPNW